MIKPNNNCIKKACSILNILTSYDLYPDFMQKSSVAAMDDGGLSISISKEGWFYSVDIYNDLESTIMIKRTHYKEDVIYDDRTVPLYIPVTDDKDTYIYDFNTEEELFNILNKHCEISRR